MLPAADGRYLAQLLYQRRLMERVRELPGDVVECGVGYGHTLLGWCALVEEEGDRRRIWGFDSFEGFPEPTAEDESPRAPKRGEWNVANVRTIHQLLVSAGFAPRWIESHVTLITGFFDRSLAHYKGNQIALLHVDVDLYQSYKTVLDALYSRVVPGGVIAFDEYLNTEDHYRFPGAAQAIDEFLDRSRETIQRCEITGKYYLVKQRPVMLRAASGFRSGEWASI